jgi:RNA polymerase sigma-70 factor (ECF subfamily)
MGPELIVEHVAKSADRAESPGDAELVAAINQGSHAAFETIYRRHRDWVMNLAFRFTGDEALALDVMQETFLYLLRKFPGFELRAQLRTFLYPAVRNLSIAARRKAGRCQAGSGQEDLLATLPAPELAASGSDDLAAVLAGLAEEQREVLLVRFVDGLSLEEISVALEIPLGTVKSRLHNALKLLRENPRTRELFGQ